MEETRNSAQNMEEVRKKCMEIPLELESTLRVSVNIEEFLNALAIIEDLFVVEDDVNSKYKASFVFTPDKFFIVASAQKGMATCKYEITNCEIEGVTRINMCEVNIQTISSRLNSITRFRQQEMTTLIIGCEEPKRANALMGGSKQKLTLLYDLNSRDKKRDDAESWSTLSKDSLNIMYVQRIEDKMRIVQDYSNISFNMLVSEDLKYYLNFLPNLNKSYLYFTEGVVMAGDGTSMILCLNSLPQEFRNVKLFSSVCKVLNRALSLNEVVDIGEYVEGAYRKLCFHVRDMYLTVGYSDISDEDEKLKALSKNVLLCQRDTTSNAVFKASSPEEFANSFYRDFGLVLDKRDFYDKLLSLASVNEGKSISISYKVSKNQLSLRTTSQNGSTGSGNFADICNVIACKGMENIDKITFSIVPELFSKMYPKASESYTDTLFFYIIPKQELREQIFTDEQANLGICGVVITDDTGSWVGNCSVSKVTKLGRKEIE